jgi:putative colanic acid biosynthesis UDP-glucose lipid carrier transferase
MVSYPPAVRVHWAPEPTRLAPVVQAPPFTPGKRLFDVLVSLLVLALVLSWLVPLVSLLIHLTSPGPVFFRQRRTGRFGRRFYCLKFRTMVHDPGSEFQQAIHGDLRVTILGRVLRKTNLDEMPQFINVLRGEMSVVGPRPHAVLHDAQLWNQFTDYSARYAVRPGITGLAQVRGQRGLTSERSQMAHRLRYDRFYINQQSLWLDLKICWWTFWKMLTGDDNAF